jgi:hypothetical protein
VARQLEGLCAHFGRLAEDNSLFEHQWGNVLRSVKDKHKHHDADDDQPASTNTSTTTAKTATNNTNNATNNGNGSSTNISDSIAKGDTPLGGLEAGVLDSSLPEPLLQPPQQPSSSSGGIGAAGTLSADSLAVIVDGPSLVHVLGNKQRQVRFYCYCYPCLYCYCY